MLLTNIPTRLAVTFASGAGVGYRNAIPVAASPTAGAASYTTGFVPANFTKISAGGIPPYGQDINGVLFDITNRVQWQQAGGNYAYDATFSTAISGYPKGATLLRSDSAGYWVSTADNNTTNPDATSSANWLALRANTGTTSIAVTSGSNTPTPEKLGAQVLLITGALTANAALVLPLNAGSSWTVANNTTGAFTLTVIGATGAGVAVVQGTGVLTYTDGTNFYAISSPVSGAYLPLTGTAVAATKLATARNFSLAGVVTSATVSFDGTGAAVLTAAFASNPALPGVPTADTAAPGTNTTQLASTAFVQAAIAAALANYLPKNNPTFTGTMTGPLYNKA